MEGAPTPQMCVFSYISLIFSAPVTLTWWPWYTNLT